MPGALWSLRDIRNALSWASCGPMNQLASKEEPPTGVGDDNAYSLLELDESEGAEAPLGAEFRGRNNRGKTICSAVSQEALFGTSKSRWLHLRVPPWSNVWRRYNLGKRLDP